MTFRACGVPLLLLTFNSFRVKARKLDPKGEILVSEPDFES